MLIICGCGLHAMPASGDTARSGVLKYTADGRLERPADYREWVFLTSGFDMSYAAGSPMDGHTFDNVFVDRQAYGVFMATGTWPDKTALVIEDRAAESKGSINKLGQFQVDAMGFGAEVKDSSLADKWAYYNFEDGDKSAEANPKTGCFQCHEDHAAVEHSFVQFYPTLKPVAVKFGTYNQEREKVTP